jgi:hypothetical protein
MPRQRIRQVVGFMVAKRRSFALSAKQYDAFLRRSILLSTAEFSAGRTCARHFDSGKEELIRFLKKHVLTTGPRTARKLMRFLKLRWAPPCS